MKAWHVILAVGGLAVIAVIFLKSSKPKAATASTSFGSQNTVAGLASLIGSASNLVNAIRGPGNVQPSGGTPSAYSDPGSRQTLTTWDGSNIRVTDNAFFTDANGQFIVG